MDDYKAKVNHLKRRLNGPPTTCQSRYYHNIINQLKAAGIKPYEAVEKSADAYRCICQKNKMLAIKAGIKIPMGGGFYGYDGT